MGGSRTRAGTRSAKDIGFANDQIDGSMWVLFVEGLETHIVTTVLGSANIKPKTMDRSVSHVRFRKK